MLLGAGAAATVVATGGLGGVAVAAGIGGAILGNKIDTYHAENKGEQTWANYLQKSNSKLLQDAGNLMDAGNQLKTNAENAFRGKIDTVKGGINNTVTATKAFSAGFGSAAKQVFKDNRGLIGTATLLGAGACCLGASVPVIAIGTSALTIAKITHRYVRNADSRAKVTEAYTSTVAYVKNPTSPKRGGR